MQRNNINPAIFQPFLESAANAGDKGEAQFLTPLEWGRALSLQLPRFRPVIIDLSCGAGHLLQAAARGSTNHLLGCDIDPCPLVNDKGQPADTPTVKRIVADVTKLYGLMRQVDLRADCFVLNPAWDLHQYRKVLAELAESDLPTVRAAFTAHDGRTGRDTVDSTVASLCLALDRSSDYGEGFLIGNESTLQRLILGPGAPHAALGMHVWAHLVITGNICDPKRGPDSQFRTGVIYFARAHDAGPTMGESSLYQPPLLTSLAQAQSVCAELHKHRLDLRLGAEIKSYAYTDDTVDKWQAVAGEWERLTRKDKPQWNLSLRADDTIKTDLSLFDTHSARVSKQEAESLFSLEGKRPMQLVMQRQQRVHLERAAFGTTWRVDPKLQAAIPDVPDVARVNPDGYQRNLQLLKEIEDLCV